jgi:hypothetical protein
MITEGWGRSLLPPEAPVDDQEGAAGGQASSPEEAQEIRLEEYQGWSQCTWSCGGGGAQGIQVCGSRGQSTGGRGRTAVGRPSPPRGRMVSAQSWTEGCPRISARPRRTPCHDQDTTRPPNTQGRLNRGGQHSGQGAAARPQQLPGQPHPDPQRMPGLLQPPGPADTVQQLALMMAIMVLGMLQTHDCHAGADSGMLWDGTVTEAKVCPPTVLEDGIGISASGDQLDPNDWKKLPAVHCRVTQSALTFMCGLDGRMGKVKFEKFQQPCGIQATACWEVVESSKLKVGELEHPVVMNTARSQMGGGEEYSRGCILQTGLLNRKITQVLMEVLIEKEWIWWNEAVGKVATALGMTASVFRGGRWSWRTGCGCGQCRRELEVWIFPQLSTKSRSTVGEMQVWVSYSCSAAGECAMEAAFWATQQRIAITCRLK